MLRRHLLYISGLTILTGAVFPAFAQESKPSYSKMIFNLGKPVPAPKFVIDVSDSPDVKPWAEEAQKLATEWFSSICQILSTERYKVPDTIKFTFKKGIDPPAYASGNEIVFKVEWIKQRPEDFGIVIHELTHIIQSYRNTPRDTGWLVEGIADYVRWWRYEPEAPRSRIDPAKASYRDAYRTTAAFLAWAVGKYDRTLVRKLDEGLRHGTYSADIWEKSTGKKLDDLWAEFVGTLK